MQCVDDLDFLFSTDDDSDFSESSRSRSSFRHVSVTSSESDDDHHRKSCIPDFINKYSDEEFKRHFRIKKSTFQYMLDVIHGPYETMLKRTHSGGKAQISAKDCLLISLWYFSNTESFKEVADRFDIDRSTACVLVHRMVEIVCSLVPQFIRWPSTQQMAKSELFFKKKGIPYVIGAIDSTTLQIPRPSENQQNYYSNKKKYHCIVMQAVVNHRLEYIDIFVGEPGSQHDARVFAKSNLYSTINSNLELMHGYSILGDSAYPELNWLITPFQKNGYLTDEQLLFNEIHSSSRILVKHAFGHLKKRFRRIASFGNLKLDFIKSISTAAVVFHNICISQNDKFNCNDSCDEESDNEQENNDVLFAELGIQQANRTSRVYKQVFGE